MTLASQIQYQDYRFQQRTPQGVWKWVTRVDMSGPIPVYLIREVATPMGLMRESTSIPGDVVQSMAASIGELQQAFPPSIVLGPPTSLTFDVDEGRGFSQAQTVQVSNGGVYGSLLGVSLSVSAEYVRVAPTEVGNLTPDESGSFDVSVDSTSLLTSESPYAATVILQNPSADNSPQVLPVTINVRPKATITMFPTVVTFRVTRSVDGTFPVLPAQQFQVQNSGPLASSLEYIIRRLTGLSDWLVGFSPASGTVPGGSAQDVTVLVRPVQGMGTGTYEETLRVGGYSTNSYADVLIRLIIT